MAGAVGIEPTMRESGAGRWARPTKSSLNYLVVYSLGFGCFALKLFLQSPVPYHLAMPLYGRPGWLRSIVVRLKGVYSAIELQARFNEGCLAKLSDVTTYKIIQALYAIVVKIAKYYTDTVS